MVGVRGRPIFLNWGLREHGPASCYINPGELELDCVCGGGGGGGENGLCVA